MLVTYDWDVTDVIRSTKNIQPVSLVPCLEIFTKIDRINLESNVLLSNEEIKTEFNWRTNIFKPRTD